MTTLPYIPKSIRDKQFWEKASSALGVHPVVARCIRLDYLCMESDTWLDYIVKKKIKNLDLTNPFSEEEIEKKQKSWEEASLETDFTDLMHYRQKQLVEVGDEIVCDETETYLSCGTEYMSRGKRYKILCLSHYGLCGFTARTTTNIENQDTYTSYLGANSIWRDGVEIWNWNMAYLDLFIEQKPNHPQTDELQASCMYSAEYTRTGAEKPCKYTIEQHDKSKSDPIYMQGYNADDDADNPYEFNRELSHQRSCLAMQRHLSDTDRKRLTELADAMDATEWHRWGQGNYAKKYSYLK